LLSLGKAFVRARISNSDLEKSLPALGGIGVARGDGGDNSDFVKASKVGEAFPTFAEIEAGY